jgi:hypothetical protein
MMVLDRRTLQPETVKQITTANPARESRYFMFRPLFTNLMYEDRALSLWASLRSTQQSPLVSDFSQLKLLIKSRDYHSTNDGGAAHGLRIQPAYHNQLAVDMQKLRTHFGGTVNIALEVKQDMRD